jgi:mRNA-degrading endonuclease RelE of RelBE toxin-antitoxin system
MNWVCNISNEAVKQFKRLPRDRQELLYWAIEAMKDEPLKGDVRFIKSGNNVVGDVNGDGRVDALNLDMLSEHFGEKSQ